MQIPYRRKLRPIAANCCPIPMALIAIRQDVIPLGALACDVRLD
jgi:hypothetical protein